VNRKTCPAGLIIAAVFAVAACGESTDERLPGRDSDAEFFEDSIDLSDLPGDFPRELMPPAYDKADYVDLSQINGTRVANFESTSNVQGSIDHYIGLLGEPTINVDSGDGDRLLQWRESPHPPWTVSVMGNIGETIVTVGTMPER
jgi:hypothetical protein